MIGQKENFIIEEDKLELFHIMIMDQLRIKVPDRYFRDFSPIRITNNFYIDLNMLVPHFFNLENITFSSRTYLANLLYCSVNNDKRFSVYKSLLDKLRSQGHVSETPVCNINNTQLANSNDSSNNDLKEKKSIKDRFDPNTNKINFSVNWL